MASVGRLVAGNTPWGFWRLLGEFTVEDWESAVREALGCLAGLPAATCPGGWAEVAASVLGEGQFGPGHWQLGASRRCYYAMRRLLPPPARGWLQRLAGARASRGSLLRWPVEDRYVQFQFEAVRRLCERHGLRSVPYIHFWPQGRRFAFVLTHDVETAQGLAHLRRVAGLEEQYGLRSSFNFVPEAYEVDLGLLGELRRRGFEIGVHGLRHDGRLYSSRETFRKRARSINGYLRAWRAVGFRSPMTHRNPEWMQALEIEYDSSFFDTDPFEPVAGGTMSIWPFLMGRFVELPYTLAQDHTLMRTLGHETPELWLRKVEFVAEHCGMALVNTHPDYLSKPRCLGLYERFLAGVSQRGDYWHALPAEVARWWRRRLAAPAQWNGGRWRPGDLGGATVGRLSLADEAGRRKGRPLLLEPSYYPA